MYTKADVLAIDIEKLQKRIEVADNVGQRLVLQQKLNELLNLKSTYSVLKNRSKNNKFVL